MFEWVDTDLNTACRDYLQELDKIKNQISNITTEFSVKLLKMNKSNIVQGLEKNEINVESLKLNNKNPDELIAIFNALGHYSFLGTTLDNTINGVIPTIIRYLDMSTNENQVMNYLYTNLYSSLSNEQIKGIFDNIKNKEISLENWREKLKTNSLANINDIEYKNIKSDEFVLESENYYIAKNVLFHNLKVEKIEIFDTLQNGMDTLNKIEQQYINIDFKQLCSDLIAKDNYDWDDRITTSEEVIKYLKDVVYITINKNELSIWFNTTDTDLFGGHNPVLYLYSDKDYKFVGME